MTNTVQYAHVPALHTYPNRHALRPRAATRASVPTSPHNEPHAQFSSSSLTRGFNAPGHGYEHAPRAGTPFSSKPIPVPITPPQTHLALMPTTNSPRHRTHPHHAVRREDREEHVHGWVVEQQFLGPKGKYKETERWVSEQQSRKRHPGSGTAVMSAAEQRRRELDASEGKVRQWQAMLEQGFGFDANTHVWAVRGGEQQEYELRHSREREREQTVREQVKRVEEWVKHRRDRIRQEIAEERRINERLKRERERADRERDDRAIAHTWKIYEEEWKNLPATTEALTFQDIPWPTVVRPQNVEDISTTSVESFLLSSVHSGSTPRKDRIRSALLRWHPDRFGRLLGKVVDQDKKRVEEAVIAVATCLNDIMARETSTGAQTHL